MKKVDIYTDGACSGNPGAGGWGVILMFNGHVKEISGYVAETTNNRMELFSVISGLKCLKEKCDVTVYSDSAYVVNAVNNGWLKNWGRNGWKNADKQGVKNRELWVDLLLTAEKHNVSFVKVKGHSDNIYNNRCDELVRAAIANKRGLSL